MCFQSRRDNHTCRQTLLFSTVGRPPQLLVARDMSCTWRAYLCVCNSCVVYLFLHPASCSFRQLAAEIVLLNLSATTGSLNASLWSQNHRAQSMPLCSVACIMVKKQNSKCPCQEKPQEGFQGLLWRPEIEEVKLLITLGMLAYWVVIVSAKQNFSLLDSVLE